MVNVVDGVIFHIANCAGREAHCRKWGKVSPMVCSKVCRQDIVQFEFYVMTSNLAHEASPTQLPIWLLVLLIVLVLVALLVFLVSLSSIEAVLLGLLTLRILLIQLSFTWMQNKTLFGSALSYFYRANFRQ